MNDMECLLNRTTFLVDGFSLYHSAREVAHDSGAVSTRWLDVYSLLLSYLPDLGRYAQLHEMYYFSAHAMHLKVKNPRAMADYRDYVTCLRASTIQVETGGDLSARLLTLLQEDEFDTAVIVSGETDIAHALRTAKQLYPHKEICFAFPYGQQNRELEDLAGKSFFIREKSYIKYQLPNPVVISPDCIIHKPGNW